MQRWSLRRSTDVNEHLLNCETHCSLGKQSNNVFLWILVREMRHFCFFAVKSSWAKCVDDLKKSNSRIKSMSLVAALKQCHLCIKNDITERMTLNQRCHKHAWRCHVSLMHTPSSKVLPKKAYFSQILFTNLSKSVLVSTSPLPR